MTKATTHPFQVLIVDDDPIVRMIHSRVLMQEGYHITQAENGEQAVALVQQQLFDVILMDINMPKMNGLDATAKIRAYENGSRHTPIIGVTGYGEYEPETCLAKGMDTILGKPVAIPQLVNVVQEAVLAV
jgi:CheY-like chemotaxis protein